MVQVLADKYEIYVLPPKNQRIVCVLCLGWVETHFPFHPG